MNMRALRCVLKSKQKLYLLILVVAIIIYAVFILYPKPPRTAYVKVAVEGEGLVNGTRTLEFKGTVPYSVALVAEPAKYWRLAYWLVNGTKAGSSPVLTLTIRANTSVVAVFEEMVCVLRVGGREGLRFEHAGRVYEVPALLAAPCGSTLRLKPLYDLGEGEELTVILDGNRTVALEAYRLVVESGDVPVLVNGSPVTRFEGLVPPGLVVELACNGSVPLNETHAVHCWGWKVNDRIVYWPKTNITITSDTEARPMYDVGYKTPPPIKAEVLTPSGPVEVTVRPSPFMVVPFTGTYRYLKNGWLWVGGHGDAVIYIDMPPNWTKLTVEVKVWSYAPSTGCDLGVLTYENGTLIAKEYGMNTGTYTLVFTREGGKVRIQCIGKDCSHALPTLLVFNPKDARKYSWLKPGNLIVEVWEAEAWLRVRVEW